MFRFTQHTGDQIKRLGPSARANETTINWDTPTKNVNKKGGCLKP